MLKVLLLVECNTCQMPYERCSAATDRGANLINLAHELLIAVEEDGWFAYRDSTEHHCPNCNSPGRNQPS